jgi:ribosome-binding protein aMBF1 (putative translation factor)
MNTGAAIRKTQGVTRQAVEGKELVQQRVGRNMVHLRETRGWSRKELAHKLRVTKERLGRWERGERQAPLAILVRLKAMFGVAVQELVLSEPIKVPEVVRGEAG